MKIQTLLTLLHDTQMEIDNSIVHTVQITGDNAWVWLGGRKPARAQLMLAILDAAKDNGILSIRDVGDGKLVRLMLEALITPSGLNVCVYANYSRQAEPHHVAVIEELTGSVDPCAVLTALAELPPPA
jgi:phosphatidylserine/phosphatidylglycerophosphate/cardiolipin synthase-like enzyme